ncbi:MAG: DNA-methyltransferase [Emergencia sp.]
MDVLTENPIILDHHQLIVDNPTTIKYDVKMIGVNKQMITNHKIIIGNSNNISDIEAKSVHLIVTSPPYPMIAMWDEIFSDQNPEIREALDKNDGNKAFELMHELLDGVWKECDRVLVDNGFVCINIGDATRTINGVFQLYSNHTAIINSFLKMGYCVLPDVHWRKQTNAPNKYMGSGMYPAGAYVTYEHEYILIFRKGGKRVFKGERKQDRQESAFFWEERNEWFSDLWELKGTAQKIGVDNVSRKRSAAYPFEIPYRLINMYSAKNDTVLDPFVGLGTTCIASIVAQRNSIGIEIANDIAEMAVSFLEVEVNEVNDLIDDRLNKHIKFINGLPAEKKENCYNNKNHGFKVRTKQEMAIKIQKLNSLRREDMSIICDYIAD